MAAPAPVIVEKHRTRPNGRPGRPSEVTVTAPATSETMVVERGYLEALGQEFRELSPNIDDVMRDFGTDIYTRMMHHPQVSASIETEVLTTLSQEMEIQPGGAVEGEPGFDLALKISQFMIANLARLPEPFQQTLHELEHEALINGHKIAEIVCEMATLNPNDGPQLVLKAIKTKPNNAYTQVVDPYNNHLGFLPNTWKSRKRVGLTLKDIEADLLPTKKFIRRVNDPEDGNPNGTSDLRDAYFVWWQDVQLRQPYQSFLATCAQPGTKYKQREGGPATWSYTNAAGQSVTVQAHEKGLETAESVHNGSSHFLPDGDDMEFMELGTDGGVFDRAFDRFGSEIVKAITLQTLATEQGEHSSRAQSQVHRGMLALKPRFRKYIIAHMVQTQLFALLIEANFGPEALRYMPQAMLGQTEQWDLGTIGQVMNQAILAKAVFPSQLRGTHARLGMPTATEQEHRLFAEAWAKSLETQMAAPTQQRTPQREQN